MNRMYTTERKGDLFTLGVAAVLICVYTLGIQHIIRVHGIARSPTARI